MIETLVDTGSASGKQCTQGRSLRKRWLGAQVISSIIRAGCKGIAGAVAGHLRLKILAATIQRREPLTVSQAVSRLD